LLAIDAGIAVSEVIMTSLSTVIDSRIRLDSSEFGPSWAAAEKEIVRTVKAVSGSPRRVVVMRTMIATVRWLNRSRVISGGGFEGRPAWGAEAGLSMRVQ
jgi:hypothetical protein